MIEQRASIRVSIDSSEADVTVERMKKSVMSAKDVLSDFASSSSRSISAAAVDFNKASYAANQARSSFVNVNSAITRLKDTTALTTTITQDFNRNTVAQISNLQELKNKFDVAGNAAQIAGTKIAATGNMAQVGGSDVKRLGLIAQQAGYQVGDFFTQIASGQNAIVALTQQGTQLLSFFGPFGAVIGAAGAILGSFFVANMRAKEATEELSEAEDTYARALKASKSLKEEAIKLSEELAGKREDERIVLAEKAVEMAQKEYDTVKKKLDIRKKMTELVSPLYQFSLSGLYKDEREALQKLKDYQDALKQARKYADDIEKKKQAIEDKEYLEKKAEAYKDMVNSLEKENKILEAKINFGDDAAKQLEQELEIQEKLGKLTPEQVKVLKKKTDEQARLNAELEAEKERRKEVDDLVKKRLDEVKKQQEEIQKNWQRITDKMIDYGADVFEGWLHKERKTWKDFFQDIQNMAIKTFANIASQQIVGGIMGSIAGMGGASGLAYASTGGFSGATGLAGASAIGAGGLQYAGTAGSLFNAATGSMSIPVSMMGAIPANNMVQSGSASVVMNADGSLSIIPTGTAMAAGAIGGLFGNLGANAVFGNNRGIGSSIGGTLGSLGGLYGAAALGFANPVGLAIGASLGAFGGNALGGLSGGGSNKQQEAQIRAQLGWNEKGFYTMDRTATGGASISDATKLTLKYLTDLKTFMKETNLSLDKSTSQNLGALKYNYAAGGFTTGGEMGQSYETAFINQIADMIQRDVFKNIPQALSDAIDAASGSSEITEAIENWLVSQQALKASLTALASPGEALTTTEQAFENLISQFADLREQAEYLGVSMSLVNKAEAAQKKALVDEYNAATKLAALQITDPYAAAMQQWSDWADDTRREAELIGADMVSVEELIGLKRIEVMEQYADEIVAVSEETKKQISDTLQSLLDQITGTTQYGLSPMDALVNAQQQYSSALESAKTGNVESLEGFGTYATRYLDAARSVYASSSDYAAIYSAVTSAISSLIDGVPGFASGGYHSGGLRIVGENGPEIEATGPAMYWNASQVGSGVNDNKTADEIRGMRSDNRQIGAATYEQMSSMATEIKALRREVESLRREAQTSATHARLTA